MPDGTSTIKNICSIDKARLGIAWKWFDFHAKQRTTFFNFFLVITGIILNAYVLAIKENFKEIAVALCVFGILQALAFISFDIRSRQLTRHAEDVIEMVERSTLFPNSYRNSEINSGKQLGLLIVERNIGMRERTSRSFIAWLLKMKVGICMIQCAVMVIFLFGIFVALTNHQKAPKNSSVISFSPPSKTMVKSKVSSKQPQTSTVAQPQPSSPAKPQPNSQVKGPTLPTPKPDAYKTP